MTVRLLVVDDNDLLRAGLVTLLSTDPDVEVVGESADGVSAVRSALELGPDVVLMDLEMPGGDGITATAALRERAPGVRVLVLTMFDTDENVVAALRAGASGFLIKTTGPRELLRGVKDCAAGDSPLGSTVVRRLVDSYVQTAAKSPAPPELSALTERETEVLKVMARGLSNAEIAQELYLAETTVKTHVARILTKLGVRDRVRAVVLAHRCGLVDL